MLVHVTNQILSQLSAAVQQLTPEEYKRALPLLSGSSIGQHTRHILEFFICLNKGIHSGVVNYDARERDKAIEENKEIALHWAEQLKKDFALANMQQPLSLELCYDETEEENVHRIVTNLGRELAYNIEHTVHHMAIIKIGMNQYFSTIELPLEFGVAVSTLRHQQEHVHRHVSAV